MKKVSSFLAPILVLLFVLGLQYFYPRQIEATRTKIFDLFQKIKPRIYQSTPVKIIDIDDKSLAQLGQWPWPRTLLAKLTSRLAESNAKAIVFDIIFAESDRTSAKNVIPLWPKTSLQETLATQITELPDHDQIFSEAISQAPVVTAFFLTPEENSFIPERKAGFAYGGDDPIHYLDACYKGAVINLPEIGMAASGNGSFNMDIEHDEILRRVPVLYRLGDALFPSLVAETIRVVQKTSTYKIKTSGASGEMAFGEKTGIVKIRIGNFEIPTDAKGRIWLYDTGYVPERYIPAWKILSGDFNPQELEGEIFFIGTSAAGLKDLRSTPLNPFAPGVEIHAQLAEQILLHEFLYRPDWAVGAEFGYLVFLGLLLVLILPKAGAVRSAVIGLTTIAAAITLSWLAYSRLHWLIDPILPSLVIFLIYLVSSFMNFLRTEKERGAIRSAFNRYLSPALVEKLARDPKQLKLGGEMKEMTFLFADIRSFTSIAEEFNAGELTHFMNRFLTPATNIILDHQGTIDKYMGDCIMAFWNAPFDDKEHFLHACQAALAMQSFLKTWNHQNKTFPDIQIGIGLNTGNACVGNMGSEQRFDYTVLGDDVNLASRLEGLSKNYGVGIILGQNTWEKLPSFASLEVDLIQVKGKKKPVRIFAFLGDQNLKESQTFKELSKKHGMMISAYRNQSWEEVKKQTAACLNLSFVSEMKLEMLYNLYVKRSDFYQKNPPGSGWNGITVATSK